MRETPCASCGDRETAVALQVGRVVLCDACTKAIPEWFFAATDEEISSFFGFAVPLRAARLVEVTRPETHAERGRAYREMHLDSDAALEWALAAMAGGDAHEAIARLLEPVVSRGTIEALARALGFHRDARRRTAS